jgi:hypothetical protein
MRTLTIIAVALVVVATVAECVAANGRGRRQAARWRASIAREDAPRGGKA